MSNIQTFNFEHHQVRTAIKNGEPLFCLTDVAEVLELTNSRKTATQLDPKGVQKLDTPTKGGMQQITFINEPNLYRVIFRSNKKEAVKFQNWVFDDVLPSIRKTGVFQTPTIPTDISELSPLPRAVGSAADYTLYSTLDAMIRRIAECYVDSERAYGCICQQLTHLCGAGIQHMPRERLPYALQALSFISREALRHKQLLEQVDDNALVSLATKSQYQPKLLG